LGVLKTTPLGSNLDNLDHDPMVDLDHGVNHGVDVYRYIGHVYELKPHDPMIDPTVEVMTPWSTSTMGLMYIGI
jgi:hypothetical protein